jgi:WD40 repeat protein
LNIYDGIHFICGLSNGKINLYSYKTIENIKEYKINLKKELLHCEEEKNNLKIKLLTYFVYQDKIFGCGSNDGSVSIFFLNSKNKIYIKTKYDKQEISNIVNLKYDKEKSILLVGISIDKNLLIYDGLKNIFLKEINFGINYGKILSIDNLNDNLFIISHQFSDDILIIDKINYEEISKIKIEKRLIKKLFYLRDGYSIASLTGTGTQNNMGLNIIKFN